jgi:cytochrome c556
MLRNCAGMIALRACTRLWPIAFVAAACVPKRDLPPDEIRKLTELKHVMHVQATIADPQFKKIGEASYTDRDWAAFADVGSRLQVTSKKAKDFSKGPEFDALADQLNTKAQALEAAAAAKDTRAAEGALAQLKATCKTCHSKFK